jgi:hypothetical protein
LLTLPRFTVEQIGYVGRALGHYNNKSKPAYIMQSVLILVAPALFAATIYMTLGRLMRTTHSEKHSIIPARWLTKIFVIGDVLSFFIQGGGGGIMASGSPSEIKTGQDIILGGLFFQVAIFGFFILSAVILHVRMRKYPTPKSRDSNLPWEKMLIVLYTVSGLIMVRNILRIVEYLGGREGPLLRVEWPIYVFDGLLMAATMAVFFIGYPSMMRPNGCDTEMDAGATAAQTIDAPEGFKG